jgi:hypothetical protein
MRRQKTSRDPIFATIAAHQSCQIDGCAGDLRTSSATKPTTATIRKWIAAEKAEDAAWHTRDAAALRLVRIKPTTIDGAIALLNCFADIGADDVLPISDRAAEKLGAPFGCIVARNVAHALERVAA